MPDSLIPNAHPPGDPAPTTAAANAGTADPTALRLALRANAYRPVPILRHDANVRGAGKAPTLSDWPKVCATATADDIRQWALDRQQRHCTNTGVLCGALIALDLDVPDPELARQIEELADVMLPPTPLIRIGKAPKSLRVFRAEGTHRKTNTPALILPGGTKVQVEALGEGNQFVAFGIHPETRRPYTWLGRVDGFNQHQAARKTDDG